MLKNEILYLLNEQLNLELFSANIYLQISAWCHNKGLEGSANFFKYQSKEEMDHMYKFFNYINDKGGMPILSNINAPSSNYSCFIEIINFSYMHEKSITKKISHAIYISMKHHDYLTYNFLQENIISQYNGEKLFKLILDKISLLNLDSNGLFLIDQFLNTQIC